MADEAKVRGAFAAQAGWCAKLGSPFTSRLCEAIGPRLDTRSAVGRRILGWAGEPGANQDSVPLRLCGGLHGLVRAGRLPGLASLYPPNALPGEEALWAEVARSFASAEPDLMRWLDGPPQTNEVARSGVLAAGLAVVAAEMGLPLALYELGASAGLNLLPDRYDCRCGGRRYGDPASAVRLEPAWTGADPPPATLLIAARRGIDVNPLDVTAARDRERLLAYVWADQADRLARLEAALAVATADPPALDRGDAADWVEARIALQPGMTRVVMHSIAFQYFPEATQARIAAHLDRVGRGATREAPLAWLRYETEPGGAALRLRLWPEGGDHLLARADLHARDVKWLMPP